MRLNVLKKPRAGESLSARAAAFFRNFDYAQIASMVLILSVGILFIRSTGEQAGTTEALDAWVKQLTWGGIGLGAWALFAFSDYRKLEPFGWVIYAGALLLLVAVLIWGPRIFGAKRWLILNFGVFRQQFQPSELGKIGLILVLASTLGNRGFRVDRWRHLGVVALLIVLPFTLVVIEPDLGGSLIFLPIAGAMVFAAGIRMKKILILAVAALILGGAFAANEIFRIKPLLRDYHRDRIRTFWEPHNDPLGRDYNANQARLAVGSGGLLGKGIGQGTQNALGFIPRAVANNDFIFSVIAEETGFLGCTALLGCFILLLYAIFRTAWIAGTPYGRYLAVGFGVMLFEHVFINMGMSIGLTPVTGLPLPLVSYGGTFVVTTMAMLGVIQSVYRYSKLEEAAS